MKCLFNRAYAYDKLGMYDEAIAGYTEVIKYCHDNAFAYFNRYSSMTPEGSPTTAKEPSYKPLRTSRRLYSSIRIGQISIIIAVLHIGRATSCRLPYQITNTHSESTQSTTRPTTTSDTATN